MSRLANDPEASVVDQCPPRVGRYELGRPIATGKLATVIGARDSRTGTHVAVKLATSCPDRITSARDRLRREGRFLRRLRSPSIVRLHEAADHEGRPYLALQLAAGGSLSPRLVAGTPRDPWTTSAIVDQVAEAVALVHAHEIAHCDVHPGNLLIVRSPEACDRGEPATLLEPGERLLLGDFDIAVDLTEANRHEKRPIGTPRFRAPEQIDPAESISPATDIYALGALTWALVAGTSPPFPAEVHDATAVIPPWWARVLRTAMAADPGRRFPHARAWRDAVREALDTDLSQAGHDPLP